MAEFFAVNVSRKNGLKKASVGFLPKAEVSASSSAIVGLNINKSNRGIKREASPELSAQKGVLLFARFIDFMKVLSSPEICFLLIVIKKTNYGNFKEVPIPRSDFLQDQAIPSLAIKQIREKLIAMGLIDVIQKRIGRGSEAWLYSLRCEKFAGIFSQSTARRVKSPSLDS